MEKFWCENLNRCCRLPLDQHAGEPLTEESAVFTAQIKGFPRNFSNPQVEEPTTISAGNAICYFVVVPDSPNMVVKMAAS